VKTAKTTWDDKPVSEESRERQLTLYRRYMSITAKEIVLLQAAIQELGGLAIDTQEVKPDTGSLIVIKGRVALAGKVSKANKTTITIYDFTVPGFSTNGWKLSEALTGFQRVLMTGAEVREAIASGKTPSDLTREWSQRLKEEQREATE
jgi:hypothetical protein